MQVKLFNDVVTSLTKPLTYNTKEKPNHKYNPLWPWLIKSNVNFITSVLEVGRHAPVRSTGTSRFDPLEYLHFFVRTGTSDMLPVIRVKSSGSG